MSILQYFQGSPRDVQRDILLALERVWRDYDVFVVGASVATGKSRIAHCVARWTGDAGIITPTNILVDQYKNEFPDTPVADRASNWTCHRGDKPCGTNDNRLGLPAYCRDCHFNRNMAAVRAASHYVSNYMVYRSRKLWRPTLIIDEAHNFMDTVKTSLNKTLYQVKDGFPKNLYTLADLWEWCENHRPAMANYIKRHKNQLVVRRHLGSYRGRETECLSLHAVDVRYFPPTFLPNKVKKIVLLSATINEHDIYDLWLDRRRVCYIDAPSPIPTAQRPIVYQPVVAVNHASAVAAAPRMAAHIHDLMQRHNTEKGVIHTTYGFARLLRQHLQHERLIWHTSHDKAQQYHKFRARTDNSVLVACGMQEGIDLPYDLGRWQVVTKIPYLSLGDEVIAAKARARPEWYTWQAVRGIVQASGRICRTPTDYGVTYILDKQWEPLYYNKRNRRLFPGWFIEAVR